MNVTASSGLRNRGLDRRPRAAGAVQVGGRGGLDAPPQRFEHRQTGRNDRRRRRRRGGRLDLAARRAGPRSEVRSLDDPEPDRLRLGLGQRIALRGHPVLVVGGKHREGVKAALGGIARGHHGALVAAAKDPALAVQPKPGLRLDRLSVGAGLPRVVAGEAIAPLRIGGTARVKIDLRVLLGRGDRPRPRSASPSAVPHPSPRRSP